MIDRTGKIKYFDRSIEAAESILSQQATIDNLGADRILNLSRLLCRIVPVVSEQDVARMPRIFEPNTIPFVLVNSEGPYFFNLGNNQMSTAQRHNASRVIDSWGPGSKSSDEILDYLFDLSSSNGAGKIPLSNSDQEGGETTGVAFTFSSLSLKKALDLNRTPAGKIAKFTLRPLIRFNHKPGSGRVDSDVLFHELTHVSQRESRPITMLSSQDDADLIALGDELEAYHVGAGVRMAIDGSDLFDSNVTDPHLQKTVEAIRVKYGNNTKDNPFRPTRRLIEILEREGYPPDWMLSYRFRFKEVQRQLGNAGLRSANEDLSRGKRNSRYTPPQKQKAV